MKDRRGLVFLILVTLFIGGCITVVKISESKNVHLNDGRRHPDNKIEIGSRNNKKDTIK